MFTLCPVLPKNRFSKGDKINTLNRMLNKSLWLEGLSVDQLEGTYQKQTEANNIRGYTQNTTYHAVSSLLTTQVL